MIWRVPYKSVMLNKGQVIVATQQPEPNKKGGIVSDAALPKLVMRDAFTRRRR